MKKTYIKPEMEIEVLELENMIAVSTLSISDDAADAALDMESKERGSIWEGINLW